MDITVNDYEFIDRDAQIPLVLAEAEQCKYIGLDTENSGGLDVLKPEVKLLLVQLEIRGKAYLIDARKVDISLISSLLTNRKRWTKIVQNANYDYKILKVLCGIPLRGIFDTMIAESLLHMGIAKGGNSLEVLSQKYAEHKMNKDTRLTFANHPYDEPYTEEQLCYAAGDVLVLPTIRRKQQMYLNQYRLNPIAELEFALIEPVAEMELAGITLDIDMWRKSLANTNKKLFKISNELRQVLPDPPALPPKPVRLKKDGTPFANSAKLKPPPVLNLDSWQQLVTAFNSIGVDLAEVNKKTKKGPTNSGTIKVAQSVYSDDSRKVTTLKNLIKYRELNQVKKTFGENLIDHVGDDGRIHARFWQNGTESGRFSSTEPNLQNIQKKGEEGRILRSCFIPAPGHKFIIADYSQIELRIAAELSNDPVMLATLQDPKGDIHRATASQMYKVAYDSVSSTLRRAAKTLNFGIIYGMMVKTLSERLECSFDEAEEMLRMYNDTYSVLMEWLDNEGNAAYNRGWTRTIGGRIRWFPTLNEKDYETRREFNRMVEFFKRVGKNHPIQGTSADMTKTSIVLLYFPLLHFASKFVNTIHDELCIESPIEYAVEVARAVKEKMIYAGEQYLHKVPVLVDVKIRDSWWASDDVPDDENCQQLWLMPTRYGLDENGNGS
uniref:Putative DNA polymerase n=1 Tax=viral metagenome TaxID=1070528 RepID=A0A6M3JNX6_9ZZZZ